MTRPGRWLEGVAQDTRQAWRALRGAPGFALVAILTLALGIGANTAIFSVVNAVLLRPLAYEEPDRLVAVRATVQDPRGPVETPISAPEYLDLHSQLPALQDVAADWPISVNLTGSGDPERIQAAAVSSNYFDVLGVAPLLGRAFTPADADGHIGFVAVISWDLWQRHFGGRRDIIGAPVRLDDDPMTVIGVMPRGFRHPVEQNDSPMELWAPVDLGDPDPNFINNRRVRPFEAFARLRAGVPLATAQSQLDLLAGRLRAQYPTAYPESDGWRIAFQPLAERVVGDVRPALLVLLGAVGFVLLIACVNVANLMLTRATGRSREIAIRTALGAARSRVIRQLLTESLVLAVIGGTLGVAFAAWGTGALAELARLYLPRAGGITVNGGVLAFTAALTLVTGIAFGLLPALQASHADVQSVLKDAGHGSTASGVRTRARSVLVVVEIAVALVLVTGAGLLLRSFQRVVAVEPGFQPAHVLTLQLWLPVPNDAANGRFFTQAQRLAFYQRVQRSVSELPGVEEAALVSRIPLTGQQRTRFLIEGRALGPDEPVPLVEFRPVSANYFHAMGIPLLQGDGWSALADSAQAGAVMVSRALADKYWPGENPVGRQIRVGGRQGPSFVVAGIVGDTRQITLESPPTPVLYIPVQRIAGNQMALVARTSGDPAALKAAVIQAIHAVDPTQPVFAVMPMEQVVADAGAARRFSLLLLTLFAAMALVLSAIGIYGVMAYTTAQRRHEIGIRMALGAVPVDVFRLVVGQGLRLVGLGVAIGLGGAWLLSRVLAGQLYAITARDPVTFFGAAAMLGLVALAASWAPARRAARVDPATAIRSD